MSELITVEFWNSFQVFAERNIASPNSRKYLERSYLDFSSGYSGWHFSLSASPNNRELSCSVYIPDNWDLYQLFKEREDELTLRLATPLEWHDNIDKIASRIKASTEFEFENVDAWPTAFAWLAQQIEIFKKVLGPVSEEVHRGGTKKRDLSGADSDPSVILLTWNPEKWSPDEGPFKALLNGDLSVAPVMESWSTGTRAHIPQGTIAFLVRQHDHRGIVASGVTVGDVHQSVHWSGDSKLANFIDVEWQVAVSTAQRLTVEQLIEEFPLIPWNYLQGSGVMPSGKYFTDEAPHSTRRLVSAWDEHLRSHAITSDADSRNPAYQLQPRRRVSPDVNFADLKAVIQYARDIGREAFLKESGGNKAFRYIIVDVGFEIDAKAVLIAAHNRAHPENPINASDFEGGKSTVADPLRALGLYVEDTRATLEDDAPLGRNPQRYIELAKQLDGTLDMEVVSTQRREQAILRGAIGLNESTTAQCGICGKVYPVAFLVAGHIKKRSECTREERLDVHHVAMPICVFGCDALFERRLIKVVNGKIVTQPVGEISIDDYMRPLEANEAPGFNAARSEYFAWHASQAVVGKSEQGTNSRDS